MTSCRRSCCWRPDGCWSGCRWDCRPWSPRSPFPTPGRPEHDPDPVREGGRRRTRERFARGICRVPGMDLRIFTEPQQGASYETLLRLARAAEDCGFDGFFRSDHYLAMGDGD